MALTFDTCGGNAYTAGRGIHINELNAISAEVYGDMVAPAEQTTPLLPHAKGEYVLLDDKLYVVTSAVSAGEGLVEGENITETSVGAELYKLNEVHTYSQDGFIFARVGRYVHVQLPPTFTPKSFRPIVRLIQTPSGFVPAIDGRYPAIFRNTTASAKIGYGYVYTSPEYFSAVCETYDEFDVIFADINYIS